METSSSPKLQANSRRKERRQ